MNVITAPDDPKEFERPSIFLGGGITDAPDWQFKAIQMLESFVTCFNPRRPQGFTPPDHPQYRQQYQEQIQWEHRYLLAVDVVLFWMPKEALAITTRFEIGWCFGMNILLTQDNKPQRPFVVGIEQGVQGDTYYHVVLPNTGVPVHSTLQDTCEWACKLVKQAGN
jgi:hypothetical protein